MICRAKPYEGDEAYIFFSYCYADAEKIYPVIEEMVSQGYRIWYDERIKQEDDLSEIITKKLAHAEVFIAAISSSFSQSHNCRNEMNFAIQNEKYLISLKFDECVLTLAMQLQLASKHMIMAYEYSFNDLIEKISECESLKKCLGEKQKNIFNNIDTAAKENHENKIEEKSISEVRECVVNKTEVKSKAEEFEHVVNETEEKIRSEQHEHAEIKIEEYHAKLIYDVADKLPNDDETVLQYDEATVMCDYDNSDDTVLEDVGIKPVLVRLKTNELFSGNYMLTSLGRSKSNCDIYFESVNTISSHHADIVIHDGHNFIVDHDSSNGTYVNGKKIEKGSRSEIQNYAEIRLSKAEPFLLAFGNYADYVRENMFLYRLISIETHECLFLFDEETVLGRAFPWASGAMTDKRIGRQHAVINIKDNQVYITDTSKNGVFVNEAKIENNKAFLLNNKDHIRLGKENFIFSSEILIEKVQM